MEQFVIDQLVKTDFSHLERYAVIAAIIAANQAIEQDPKFCQRVELQFGTETVAVLRRFKSGG